MNPRVEQVAVEPGHTLRLTLANGEQRRFGMERYPDVPVFQRLRDPAFFALARATQDTVTWPGGIDFDPDTLYLDSIALGTGANAPA